MSLVKILLIEPFYTGSHRSWALDLQKHSAHAIAIMGMSGHYWKWRMHGGAVRLARQFMESDSQPDLILVSDMLDLTTFQALTRSRTAHIPFAVYFHENQLLYPWSLHDRDVIYKRDHHYGFINYTSALAANQVFFNSDYHREGFLAELRHFLKNFPDNNELGTVDQIAAKSKTLYLGVDLKKFDLYRKKATGTTNEKPLILWNHRWEYDKNPEDFFNLLFKLSDQGLDFEVAVLGESYPSVPEVFSVAQERLGDKIKVWGYQETFEDYASWLCRADILPVTSNQDFFGISIMEAIYCGAYPLLPDRLVYPEHFPEEERSNYIYRDDKDLENRLIALLTDAGAIDVGGLPAYVAKYDWSHCADTYDRAFEQVC